MILFRIIMLCCHIVRHIVSHCSYSDCQYRMMSVSPMASETVTVTASRHTRHMLRLDAFEQNDGSPSVMEAREANAESIGGGRGTYCGSSDKRHTSPKSDDDNVVRNLDDANRFLFCLTHELSILFWCFCLCLG